MRQLTVLASVQCALWTTRTRQSEAKQQTKPGRKLSFLLSIKPGETFDQEGDRCAGWGSLPSEKMKLSMASENSNEIEIVTANFYFSIRYQGQNSSEFLHNSSRR
jgi:hypothetical protein